MKPNKDHNFQTEQDWLDVRQVEINERRLITVPSVQSVRAEINRKVETLPARADRNKRASNNKKEDQPKKILKKN